MVDHGRCREPSLCFAPHTQRMPAEVRLADTLPLAAVATLSGRRSVGVKRLVLLAVLVLGQIRTAGVTAWAFTLPRIADTSFEYNKSRCGQITTALHNSSIIQFTTYPRVSQVL